MSYSPLDNLDLIFAKIRYFRTNESELGVSGSILTSSCTTMAAGRFSALALLASVHSLHLTRQQVLRSVALAPTIALPALADDDLKGLLGAVVENEEAKQAKRDADAALEEKLSKMSAGERIRYERAEAAKTNKAAADEAMRKIKTLVGDSA